VTLTRERLRTLNQIEHVEAVVPTFRLYGWAVFDRHAQAADMVSAKPDNASLRQRILAGRLFDTSERSAVVSEFLLYQLGVTDDAAINGVVDKKLRLEFRPSAMGPASACSS